MKILDEIFVENIVSHHDDEMLFIILSLSHERVSRMAA